MKGKGKQPSDKNMSETIDGQTGSLDPPPRRIDLSNLRDIRLELAHVYREMDCGKLTSADGTKRAYVLKTIHDVIVSAELERRIQELEDQRGVGPNGQRALPEHTLN